MAVKLFTARVGEIYATLQSLSTTLTALSPAQQAQTAEQLQGIDSTLDTLNQKVQATYKNAAGALEGADAEELAALAQKLKDSAQLLEAIHMSTAIASQILEYQSEMDAIDELPSPEHLSSLRRRITELKTAQVLNPGASSAIDTLEQCLNALQQLPAPPQSSFQTRLRELQEQEKTPPEEVFEDALALYREISASNPEHPLLDDTMIFLVGTVERQEAQEAEPASSSRSPSLLDASDKKSGEMRARLLKLIERPAPSHSEGQVAMNTEVQKLLEQFPHVQDLMVLAQIINVLNNSPHSSTESLFGELQTKGHSLSFKMSHPKPQKIFDRLVDHLRSLLPRDQHLSYTLNVFAGEVRVEKDKILHAINRTSLEVLVETLEPMIHQTSSPGFSFLLNFLDNEMLTKLDPLPGGFHSISSALFQTFYQLHVEARKSNPSLADPEGSRYRGDFGRIAFVEQRDGIDPALKLKALDHIRQLLKEAWKI